MSRSKSDLSDKDLLEIYDLVWSQFKEDRENIMELFKDLSAIVKSNPTQYAVSGDTLGKYAELLTKQTAQTLELLKLLHKQKEKDETLSPEDWENITKALKSDE